MRILLISNTRLGDAVLSTGLLGHLLDRHPDARITVAAGPVPAPLFRAMPRLERLIVMRKGPWLAHWRALYAACLPVFWDLVVDLRGSATAWLLPTRRRLVFRGADDGRHRVEQLGGLFGLVPPPAPRIWTAPEDEARAAALLPEGRPVLAIGPTANWMAKTWPAERFAELARRLTRPDAPLAGAAIAVVGAPDEREAAAPLLAAIDPARLIDLVGTESLPTLGAFLRRAALYVGNDSGLMHLAAAAGAPTLGLFGPSRDDLYRPWGTRAAFVRTERSYAELRRDPDFRPDPERSLMEGLTVERAETAALALLAGEDRGEG